MVVEQAIAKYASQTLSGRRVGFDLTPQEFGTPHEPTGPARAEYRTPEHSALLAQLADGRLLATPRGALCSSVNTSADCVQVILRIGIPEVAGDSATAWMYIYEDLPDGREETDTRLLLAKESGEWKVVKSLDTRYALFGKPE